MGRLTELIQQRQDQRRQEYHEALKVFKQDLQKGLEADPERRGFMVSNPHYECTALFRRYLRYQGYKTTEDTNTAGRVEFNFTTNSAKFY